MERALTVVVSARAVASDGRSGVGAWLRGGIPAWVALLLVAATALAATIAGGFLAGSRQSPPQAAREAAPAPPVGHIVPDQLKIARGFEALAAELGANGRWTEAVGRYQEAENIYRVNSMPDAPLVARARMQVGWAQLQAGDLPDAVTNLQLAYAKFHDFQVPNRSFRPR